MEDLVCYSFQVARGMEFLASRKVGPLTLPGPFQRRRIHIPCHRYAQSYFYFTVALVPIQICPILEEAQPKVRNSLPHISTLSSGHRITLAGSLTRGTVFNFLCPPPLIY